MTAFTVTVRTERSRCSYTAIARSSFDAYTAAQDRFGLAAITVRPACA